MTIVTINDPLLESQLRELAATHYQSLEEQVLEILNSFIFPEPEAEEAPAKPEPKKKAAKSDG